MFKTEKSKLNIEKVGMSCDTRPKNLHKNLPWNAFIYIVGAPGAGKSNIVYNLLCKKSKPRFYYKQFDKVYIFSPSLHTINKKINLPDDQMINHLDINKLTEIVNEQLELGKNGDHNLFVIDDLINDIKGNIPELLRISYNRRHIGKGSTLIITSQKYNKLDNALRAVASQIIMLNNNKKELESLYLDHINIEKDEFEKLVDFVFDKKYNFLLINSENDKHNRYFKNFDRIIF